MRLLVRTTAQNQGKIYNVKGKSEFTLLCVDFLQSI